ncbi:ABC-type oligopeptide transport system ATPase subunit [Bradyrhizobium sp. RT9a]
MRELLNAVDLDSSAAMRHPHDFSSGFGSKSFGEPPEFPHLR